jgi:hypothetical protein
MSIASRRSASMPSIEALSFCVTLDFCCSMISAEALLLPVWQSTNELSSSFSVLDLMRRGFTMTRSLAENSMKVESAESGGVLILPAAGKPDLPALDFVGDPRDVIFAQWKAQVGAKCVDQRHHQC